ncbi:MAG: sugar ABC transporter permease [Firmicutes bacterium]|nr:sugar ABC transporter permease [Bacillota bacterium]
MRPDSKRIKGVSYAKYGYLFSLPFVVAFLIFSLYPLLFTAVIGFTDFKGVTATSFSFLKDTFANFAYILKNGTFRLSFQNTLIIWIINFIPQIGLALLLTYWFTGRNRGIRGQGLFKVMFYMPNIITAATVAVLFSSLFGYPIGPVNSLLKGLGLVPKAFDFTISKGGSKLIVSFIQFWQWYGYTAIILISGVLGINPELFESAEIDGASRGQTFFRITLPCLRTILLFTLITSIIGGLNMFEIPKLFNRNGGPANATITTSVFIYLLAFDGTYQYNRASAASMIMFLVIVALSACVFFLMRDKYAAAANKRARQDRRAMRKLGKGAAS